jgi:hypothetical protein
MSTGKRLADVAFEEYKVTRQISTGNGDLYCAQWRTPGWFIREELGYDGPVGLRLYTMIPQERLEERHRAAMVVPPPKRLSKKAKKAQARETRYSRRLKLEQLEMRARMQALAMRHAA